jgi:hypothetical protein
VNPEIKLVYGYVDADADEVTKVLDLSTTDWTIATGIANGGLAITAADITVQPKTSTALTGTTTAAQACALVYKKSTGAGVKPVITILPEGC